MQQLTLGEHRISYRVSGSGPDILFLHGWISSGRMWEAAMRHLTPRYRVWALDLVGFGDSRTDDPTRILSVHDQTRLVAAFCKRVGLHAFNVIGHSMGGTIALELALDYPDLIDKMALVCPVVAGHLGWNLEMLLTNTFGKTVIPFGQYVWDTVLQFSQMSCFVAPNYLRPDVVQRGLEDFQKASWGATYGGLMSLINIGLDRRLHEIRKPTLVVTGALDLTVPPAEGRLAAQRIRGAHLLELDNCHHQLPDEEPDCLHRALEGFLSAPFPDQIELPGKIASPTSPYSSAYAA